MDDECIHGLAASTCSLCLAANRAATHQAPPCLQSNGSGPRPAGVPSAGGSRTERSCPNCSRVVSTFRTICPRCRTTLRAPNQDRTATTRGVVDIGHVEAWRLRWPLREWQERALDAWSLSDGRGVVEAATGTGKTMLAMGAIEKLHKIYCGKLRVAIVVPTKVLADQWRRELETKLSIPRLSIGEQHSAAVIEWAHHPVLVTVINTARARLEQVAHTWSDNVVLLIVDECHRAGSSENARIFDAATTYRLGLSATPEREDGGHEEHVYPGMGGPVYRYPLITALDDGALAPFRSVNLYVDFSPGESLEWANLTDRISTAIWRLQDIYPFLEDAGDQFLSLVNRLAEQGDQTAMALLGLLAKRRELLTTAKARVACQDAVLGWLAKEPSRALVFHETIASAEESHQSLVNLGVTTALDHSKLKRDERDTSMSRFRSGIARVLVAVRSLDEGVDVPEASLAFIASGSRSKRQRIQRFGRILRPGPGKVALGLTILVRGTPEERAVGGRDAVLVGPRRSFHYRWPGTPLEEALRSPESNYRPSEPDYSYEEMVTLLDLGLLDRDYLGHFREAAVVSRPTGGYATTALSFSPNGWHPIDAVRDGIGIPVAEFERLRSDIRRLFAPTLDPTRTSEDQMHGAEIQAVLRTWKKTQRNLRSAGRR